MKSYFMLTNLTQLEVSFTTRLSVRNSILGGNEMSNTLKNDHLALWALELVYSDTPAGRRKVAQGSGMVVLQQDGTVRIEAKDVRWTDEHGRRFYFRLNLRFFEDLLEVVEEAPHLIGCLAG